MGMCNLTTVHANFLQVIMAEAPDALDPISALREQTRTAQRAQAVSHARANPDNQRKTEVDYELFKSKFWPKISPLAAWHSKKLRGICGGLGSRLLRQHDI